MRYKRIATGVFDRYEAAIRLEKIRAITRLWTRLGWKITTPQTLEIREAEAEYDAATDAIDE